MWKSQSIVSTSPPANLEVCPGLVLYGPPFLPVLVISQKRFSKQRDARVTNQRRMKFSINRMFNLNIFQTRNVCPCVSKKHHRMLLLKHLTESSVACMFSKQDSITNSNNKFF